jgi:hypothetical protein
VRLISIAVSPKGPLHYLTLKWRFYTCNSIYSPKPALMIQFYSSKAVCLFCFTTVSGHPFPSYLRAFQWTMCVVHSYAWSIDLPRHNFWFSFMPYTSTLSSSLFRPKSFSSRKKACFLWEGLGRNTRNLNQGSWNSKLGYPRRETVVMSAFWPVVTVLEQMRTENVVRHSTRSIAWALHI